jgi:hypothetical protein
VPAETGSKPSALAALRIGCMQPMAMPSITMHSVRETT